MKKFFEMGGVIAGALLVLFGIGAIVIGFTGRSEVRSNIQREAIVGSPDMTPSAIKSEAAKAGLDEHRPCRRAASPTSRSRPATRRSASRATCGSTRSRPRAASRTRRWAATIDTPERQAPDRALTTRPAAIDPKTKRPVENLARNIWVTETALTTALNTSFFAERVALFSIVMGFALLLTGIGFLVLAWFGVLKVRQATETSKAKAASRPPHRLVLLREPEQKTARPGNRAGRSLSGELRERARRRRQRARILEHRREQVAVLRARARARRPS